MSKLEELRNLGYRLKLSLEGDLDIQPPSIDKFTPKHQARLKEIKPQLISELKAEQQQGAGLYRFIGYMTRKDSKYKGRLVLELISNDSGEILNAYFNVNITYQRSSKKGHFFKTGRNGRFWLLPRSKFAALWIQTIGQPEKWSRVYRQMNYLKQFDFSGEQKTSYSKEGKEYKQLTDLKMVRKCI